MKTITIPLEDYNKMKEASEVDEELVNKIKRSLENIKEGKIKEWVDN
tara:strand:+ start:136 stop:276 length:141 start_codon:yes stop_codon:yes gene_type:complete